ncbi:DUF726 domain-containing protein [Floridanema aerugineum]|uniref:DUF726 domain-containing protein n=1 Tax=Floridaenema aerugineum BLCC-F46 TaxID=3153654 RepID=A0ABV4X4V8_9CYAN
MDKPYTSFVEPSQGRDEALVFLNGWRTKYIQNQDIWCTSIRKAGWKGSIYQLWWDSGTDEYPPTPIHWEIIRGRSKTIAKHYLTDLLRSIPEQKISLIAHSLGARIIHYGLEVPPNTYSKEVNNVILLGGAARTIKWDDLVFSISGKLINFYNCNDKVLNYWFRWGGAYKYSPCGIHPIDSLHSRVKNCDLTALMNTHEHDLERYLWAFSKKIR